VEEILYEHENEPMQDGILKGIRNHQTIFKRAEIKMKQAHYVMAVILYMMLFTVFVLFAMNYEFAIYMLLFLNAFFMVFTDIDFIILDLNMKKHHNYEYKRTRYAMWMSFLLMNGLYIFNFIFYISQLVYLSKMRAANLLDDDSFPG